jgi:4-hydroxy-tetrahydrodipicolinate synthase
LATDCPTVVGIKEAGGNADRVSQLRAACGPKFSILSGDDGLTLPFMALGAHGVVSVASNVAPRWVSRMVETFAKGDVKGARRLHDRLYPLFKALFLETNPAPAKAALALMGRMTEEIRLPLVPVGDATRAQLESAMKALGILR